MSDRVRELLSRAPPFRYLTGEGLRSLSDSGRIERVARGEDLYERDEPPLFVLCCGHIKITSTDGSFKTMVTRELTLFGESAVVFGESHEGRALAVEDSEVICIPGEALLNLLEHAQEMRFAQALGKRLRISMGVVSSLSNFEFALRAALVKGCVDIRSLLKSYCALCPALHAGAASDDLDVFAWSYAARRLPESINCMFSIVLSVNAVNVMNGPGVQVVRTEVRRRTCRMLMPGKAFVLLRPGQTDISDLVTCLCLHTVETLKLRALLKPIHVTVSRLSECLDRIADGADRQSVTNEFMRSINKLSSEECRIMMDMYNGRLLDELLNICIHHGDYVLYADNIPMEVATCSAAEKWESRVLSAARELLGMDKEDNLPRDGSLIVDIVSSNTTSVTFCLSPYLHCDTTKQTVRNWAEDEGITTPDLDNQDDVYYVLAERYLNAHPDKQTEMEEYDKARGIVIIEEKEYTGITVQLISITALRGNRNASCDAVVRESLFRSHCAEEDISRQHMLVNIDYAFGEQAEQVLWSLISLFSISVRSVNVMGKAGGLQGNRGDLLLPTHFILERGESPDYRCVDNSDIDAQDVGNICSRCVHVGPMITIPGTLMQNRRVLKLYRHIYGCVGLEMEGIYYEAAINKARMMGIVSPSIRSRFLYYISDLPLSVGTSLAKPMTLAELFPSLYGITRLFLVRCLRVNDGDVVCSDLSNSQSPVQKFKTLQTVSRAIVRFKVALRSGGKGRDNISSSDTSNASI